MSINVKHDSRSELYRLPGGAMPAGSSVRMRIWTSRPFRQVILRIWTDCEQKIPMRALGVYSGGIMYEAELLLPSKPGLCWYCFLLRDGARDYWYGNAYDHLGGVGQVYDEQPPSYQITVYDPAFMPPRWMREGAMYQIFPDRFFRTDIGACGRLKPAAGASGRGAGKEKAAAHGGSEGLAERQSGDPAERVKPVMHANWYEQPLLDVAANGDNAARDFFGGNLRGVTAKLDYLRLMGVTVIYLNPIFLAPSNHRYNCSDYLRIDPRVGTEDDLRTLCAEAERRGMRIMLDGVFSHTGDDSRYFNRYGTFAGKGACQGPESPYYDWYRFESFPDKYQCWWGFDTLPEVNED
ncbi:MAG: alpha-amylase family glycosyl hydrolase, partial [Candidatus Fimadaptatus sp.]